MKKRALSLLLAIAILIPASGFASANNTKLVALTFDDGPTAKYTPILLDGLVARGVKATFFLVGRNISYYPDLAVREDAEGHQVADHTWSHAWLTQCSPSQMIDEVYSASTKLKQLTGRSNYYLRAPYGAVNASVRENVGMPIILWSVDPGNGNMNTGETKMMQNAVANTYDGSIIILHDSSQKNVDVALYAIDQLRAKGYEFVTVEELFRLRGVTPQNGTVYYNVPRSAAETSFDETRLSSHWAYKDIQFVEKEKIMTGDSTGFYPNAYITRAMAATILWRMAGSPAVGTDSPLVSPAPSPTRPVSPEVTNAPDAPGPSVPEASAAAQKFLGISPSSAPSGSPSASPSAQSFQDVPAGLWYSEAIAWAHENGYLLGGTDGKFNPDMCMTKEQLYAMLARYRQTALSAMPKRTPAAYVDDDRIEGWAAESVSLFRNAGFVSKNDPQIFRPKDNATRAETAELVAWLIRNVKDIK